ncbi:hypothetical protein [Ralstonia pseudosolanacearum]|uniref:hypothetical protein n=1 Tax=Ralstonia pseudosolanacearum TaxID=1310165 RepID=UPI003CFA1F97
MAKLIRVFDPEETERRINLVIPRAACPGLLEFLAEMPYRTETPLIRGIVSQWYIKHRDAGTLDEAINEALEGTGGLIEAGPPTRQGKKTPSRSRGSKVVRQRSVTARPAGRSLGADEERPLSQQVEVPAVPTTPPVSPPAALDLRPQPPVVSAEDLQSQVRDQQVAHAGQYGTSPGIAPQVLTGEETQPIRIPTAADIDQHTLDALDNLDTMFAG